MDERPGRAGPRCPPSASAQTSGRPVLFYERARVHGCGLPVRPPGGTLCTPEPSLAPSATPQRPTATGCVLTASRSLLARGWQSGARRARPRVCAGGVATPGIYPEEAEAEVSKQRRFPATLPGLSLPGDPGHDAAAFELTVALVFVALCQFQAPFSHTGLSFVRVTWSFTVQWRNCWQPC